jgi:hypothetical protein
VLITHNLQAINSSDEFIAACSSGTFPRTVNIRFRRDNFYKMVTIKRTEFKTKRGESQGIYIQARWRPDLPLGMIVENRVRGMKDLLFLKI